jgi:predicted transcriptional regulator
VSTKPGQLHSEDNEIERLRRLIAGRGSRQDNHHNRHFLREWRIYLGLSRYELADRLDIPIWVVAEWEGGGRGISSEDQFKLFGVLGIRPEQMFERPSKRLA